jgi:hypothetical protein
MRMLGLVFGALLLAIGANSPGAASPLPFTPSAISFSWSLVTTGTGVTFQPTGNASQSTDSAGRTVNAFPVTSVSPPDAPAAPAGRTLVRTFGSGVEVTIPSTITGAAPLVVTLTDWIFNYDNNLAAADNLITAVVSGITFPNGQPRQQLFNFAALSTVPGVNAVTFTPTTLAFINSLIPGTGNDLPTNFNVAGFSLVPVPASIVLFATFGLALMGAASLRRREPLRLAA